MPIKGLVLAGGKGTRLRPITSSMSKQLLPIANRPILHYVIEDLIGYGVEEIGVVLDEGTAAEIIASVETTFRKPGVSFQYIYQSYPGGLAHAVQESRGFLGEDPFILYLGDNMLYPGISEFRGRIDTSDGCARVMLAEVPNPQDFGVAELGEDGFTLVSLEEKPKDPKSNFALVGIYFLPPEIHDIIDDLKPSARGELEITDALVKFMERYPLKLSSQRVDGWWKDTGSVEALLSANRLVLDRRPYILNPATATSYKSILGNRYEGRHEIGADCEISYSQILGPCVIGKGARITASRIGPYVSIGDGVVVDHTEVSESVVMEGAQILNAGRLSDSIIGRGCSILNSRMGNRLVVGDYSVVEVATGQ